MAGYKIDPAQLTAAARALSDIPRQTLEAPLAAVKDVRLVPIDFGQGHQASFGAYQPGVQRLAATADNYLKAAEAFAQKLMASGGKYDSNEQDTTQAVKGSGK